MRKKTPARRRAPEKAPEGEPVEEVVAAEVDDVEADVSPEEFMARRKAALAKRKPVASALPRLPRLPRLPQLPQLPAAGTPGAGRRVRSDPWQLRLKQ